MATSPILGLPQLAPNQNNKTVTANDAFSIIERSLNDVLKLDMSGGSITLTENDFRRHQVFHIETTASASNCTVPNQKRFFAFYNTGTHDITVGTATPLLDVVILVNSYVIMFADGENTIVKIADSAASAIPPSFIGIDETPATYTGSAGA
ncbi:MAG: hypothetical protein LC676_19365, partial [Loktanella sp.]|nr:hypothetical protein [Loktanella sp.]